MQKYNLDEIGRTGSLFCLKSKTTNKITFISFPHRGQKPIKLTSTFIRMFHCRTMTKRKLSKSSASLSHDAVIVQINGHDVISVYFQIGISDGLEGMRLAGASL